MPRLSVDPLTGSLVDEDGRTRLFRGLNVVYKGPPYYPPGDTFDPLESFCEEDVDILAGLGLNAIRLSVSWAALEPVRGQGYDFAYLEKIRGIVRMCASRGIWTLLEFHQDVLCPQFCGHGTPSWFYQPTWAYSFMNFPFPLRWPFRTVGPDRLPDPEQSKSWTWYLGYLTYAVSQAFQRLYDNDAGLLDSFALYWQTIAQYFKDEPYILGYELINEPWLGNIYKNPFLLLPARAALTNVHRLNEVVGKAIREVDELTPIFISGPTLDIACGFPSIPFPGPAVLAYHYYRPPQRCSPQVFLQAKVDAGKRLGAAAFMTEFEMWPGTPSGQPENFQNIARTLEAADEKCQSWLGWSYKVFAQRGEDCWDGSLFDPVTGQAIPEMERLLSRPFAPIFAGQLLSLRFDAGSRVFTMRWKAGKGRSVICVQARIWYPEGFEAFARSGDSGDSLPYHLDISTDRATGLCSIFVDSTHLGVGSVLDLTVKPRS